jgi:hypothetical protein
MALRISHEWKVRPSDVMDWTESEVLAAAFFIRETNKVKES